MAGEVWGLPRWDWVILSGLLLVIAWAVWYYVSHAPEEGCADEGDEDVPGG